MKDYSTSVVKRALVAEDDPIISLVCSKVLTKEGFAVDIAANGEMAQDMLQRKDYNLCLFDISTPAVNGRQLYEYIVEKYPKLVNGLIFTTRGVVDRDTQAFLEQTGIPFLHNPFAPEWIKGILSQALKRIEKGLVNEKE